MISAILDASALLAMLLDEPGSEKVRKLLAESAMSAINWSEVVGHFARHGATETNIRVALAPLPIARYPFDNEDAYTAGLLLPVTKAAGLSFGDRACLTLAKRLSLPVLTADRAWSGIATEIGVEIEVIR